MSLVSLTIRLIDQVSGIAPRVIGSVDRVGASIARVQGQSGGFGKLGEGVNTLGARLAGVGAGILGLGAVANSYGRKLQSTVKASAEFENDLIGISRTGNMANEQLTSLRNTVLRLAPSVGILASDIAKTAGNLINAGIDSANAEKMLEPMTRVARATKTALEDVDKASLGLFQNLNIPADQLESTFDKLWTATKRGNFELKDMAAHFQKIASRAQGVGMSGQSAAVELAAAAEIVRQGAGSPGQAATNLDNLLVKLKSPQTLKKFQEYGVDLNKEINDGVTRGQSPLETVILQARKVLAENKDITAGNLFQDMQAQAALAKLVEKYEEFISIRDEAMKSSGTISEDFAAMMKTTKAMLDKLDAEIDARQKKWAKAGEPWTNWRTDKLSGINKWLGGLTERFPRLSAAFASISLGVTDMLSVMGQLGEPLLGIMSALAIGKFLGIGKVLGGVGRAAFGLLSRIRFVFTFLGGMFAELAVIFGPLILRGLMALGPFIMSGIAGLVALLSNPVGWAVLAVAVAAALAYYFREPITKGFQEVSDWIGEKWKELCNWFTSIDVSGFFAAGSKIITSLWDGMKSIAQQLLGWAGSLVGKLKSLFSFSVSPSVGGAASPGAGGGGAVLQKQSYGGGLTPAPGLQRQASNTFHNTFTINGSDNPETVAQRIVNALDRQRQAGLYDGALA